MIEIDHLPTLPATLRHYAALHAGREFVVHGMRRLSFAAFERECAQLARGMLAHGIGKATRVGILMPDGIDFVLALLAAARIGAFCVPLSTLYQPRELRWVIRHADIDTLLMADQFMNHDFIERVEEAVPGLAAHGPGPLRLAAAPYLRNVVVWGTASRPWSLPGPDHFLACADAEPRIDEPFLLAVEASVAPADLALMIWTSGTTADPKGVPHTHGGLVRHTHALLRQSAFAAGDRVLPQMPLFWIGGLNVTLFPALYRGATLVYPESRDPGAVLDLIEQERINWITAWPQQFAGLRAHPAYTDAKVRTMKRGTFSFFGTVDESGRELPTERTVRALGMSECFGPHGEWPVGVPLPPEKQGSFGVTIDGMERYIGDPDTGAALPLGEKGELYIRGYALTPGLYKKERHETFTADGWYRTGDLCSMDADGHIYFHGRSGDMVKTMGANVAPREVEVVLESFDEIKEAVVVGIPDEQLGERLVAVVLPAAGVVPDVEALRQRLKHEVSAYKIPKEIRVVRYEQIPRTGGAKVHKRLLREAWLNGTL
ncbi:MAG: class I adenylate-forming enzyme family protein [Gammaproteobacteria bacterium]